MQMLKREVRIVWKNRFVGIIFDKIVKRLEYCKMNSLIMALLSVMGSCSLVYRKPFVTNSKVSGIITLNICNDCIVTQVVDK